MRIITNPYTEMPNDDHYAVLHFTNNKDTTVTKYITFNDRQDFCKWVETNRDEKFHSLIARKLDVEVKVDVIIKNFDKNISAELTSTP